MLAVHAVWTSASRVAVWAEDPGLPLAVPRRGRPAKKPRPHPFAADPVTLAEVVAATRAGLAPEPGELVLALPSAPTGPCPSPQLWVEERTEPTALTSWRVPAVELAPAEAVDWLLAVEPIPGLVFGDTVRFLAQLARFAAELASRGKLVPGLICRGSAWEARWKPLVGDPDDAVRRRTLIRGTPPLLRTGSDGAPVDPAERFDAALHAFADAVAREALAGVRATGGKQGSAEAALIRALASSDGALQSGSSRGRLSGVEALAARLEAWTTPIGPSPDGFRTCFRVTAPEPGSSDEDPTRGPGWRLDLLLQAIDDPSLLIDVAEVWQTRGQILRSAGRAVREPQEKLLADLGRASRVAPVLAGALRTARPTGLDLDVHQAWDFLRTSAPILIRAGFGVLAPRWWGRPGARLGLRMRASPRAEPGAATGGAGVVGLDALCDVQWDVVLGDDPLSFEELERLSALKAPLVAVRGEWAELRPEDVAAALAFYDQQARSQRTAREVLRIGSGLAAGEAPLPVVGLAADGWLGELLSDARETRFASEPTPPGFGATLRPYQERGLGWLAFHDRLGLGACLADDMGLGKTVQLLALLTRERGDQRVLPTLLVCPMSLLGNWEREAARFAPGLRVHVHHGVDRKGKASLADADLVLTTYALATRDAELLGAVSWGRVVLDEAQNIKNAGTRQAKAVLGLSAPHRVALTGTPVENRLSELWSILEFLNPGLLGTAASFRKEFAIPIERYGDDAAAARLRSITAPFVLRRLKTDRALLPDLPDKLEMKVVCSLTREQATLYKAVVDELLAGDPDDPGRRGAVLGALTRLKQVCDHPALLLQDRSALPDRSGKLARLEEILDEVVANGEKALVFTQFAEMGTPLKAHLQSRLDREVLFLHGGTPRAARDAMVARFGESSGPPVFLLSLKAGGTGLNLVAANHVIHLDRWWNPAVEDQATDRAFRLGQTRDVQVRKLVCAGTVEERIDSMIEGKRALAGKVVEAGEGWLADLSAAALRDLVALDERAVAEG